MDVDYELEGSEHENEPGAHEEDKNSDVEYAKIGLPHQVTL